MLLIQLWQTPCFWNMLCTIVLLRGGGDTQKGFIRLLARLWLGGWFCTEKNKAFLGNMASFWLWLFYVIFSVFTFLAADIDGVAVPTTGIQCLNWSCCLYCHHDPSAVHNNCKVYVIELETTYGTSSVLVSSTHFTLLLLKSQIRRMRYGSMEKKLFWLIKPTAW